MVNELLNPIIIIIVALATGFLLPIVDKKNKSFTVVLFFMALIWIGLIALNGVVNFSSGAVAVEVITAGISPPFSINLQFGLFESVFWQPL